MEHNYDQESVELHKKLSGKIAIHSKYPVNDMRDLSLIYTPGVAQVCKEIHKDPTKVYDLTIKRNMVAIVTDGSAVLGLGNIGPEAALPVMEGKAVLFKQYANIDAFPICLKTQETTEIINIVRNISPVFGGINLEDIAAPRCFEIEEALQDLGIPVFHDDQHGTAIVLLTGLINAAKLANKELSDLKVVVNGAGAAGTAIVNLLLCSGFNKEKCHSVKEILVCDSKGIISKQRQDIRQNAAKNQLANMTNSGNIEGFLTDAVKDADVFVGVSVGNALTQDMVRSMSKDPIVFALANPTPEIEPELAYEAGAFIVATGRSDYPNQVNNALVFPGIFRGALDARAGVITKEMKLAAAFALAESVKEPKKEKIIPGVLEKNVAEYVAAAVSNAYSMN